MFADSRIHENKPQEIFLKQPNAAGTGETILLVSVWRLHLTSRRNTQRFLVIQDLTSLNYRLSNDTKNR